MSTLPFEQNRLAPKRSPKLLAAVFCLGALAAAAPSCVTTETSRDGLPEASNEGKDSPDGKKASASGESVPTEEAPDEYRFKTQNELFVRLDAALKAHRDMLDDPVKAALLEKLAEGITRANLSTLLTEIRDGSERNRIISAAALGYSDDPVVRPPLVKALADLAPGVVSNALRSLARVGVPGDGLDAAIALLRNADPAIRSNAALALATVTPHGPAAPATEPLIVALQDEDPVTRANAAFALGAIGDTDAVGHLAQSLSDDMPRVRALAAQSLGQLGNSGATRALIGRLGDSNSLVRDRARKALVAITGQDLGPEPKDWEPKLRP
jgi:HEAT repeat protein